MERLKLKLNGAEKLNVLELLPVSVYKPRLFTIVSVGLLSVPGPFWAFNPSYGATPATVKLSPVLSNGTAIVPDIAGKSG